MNSYLRLSLVQRAKEFICRRLGFISLLTYANPKEQNQ